MAKSLTADLLQQVIANQTDATAAVAAAAGEIKTLAVKVEEMHKRLFGNGQPGVLHFLENEIKTVDDKVDTHKESLDLSIKALDNKFIRLGGIATGAGAVAGIGVKYLLGKIGWHF